jgi:DNA-directed RNA polymerase subunit M/transcription elongation factor TFIIS
MPTTCPGLVLTSSGDVKSAKITVSSTGCQLTDIQKYLKKKTLPDILGTYPWKNQTLHLLGYKEGKAGTENKHELPPPLDSCLAFGDILVLLSKDKRSFLQPIVMKAEEYENFYTQMFEGFESLGEEDTDTEEEEEEDVEVEDLKDGVIGEEVEVADDLEGLEDDEEDENSEDDEDVEEDEEAEGGEVGEEADITEELAEVPVTAKKRVKAKAAPRPEKIPVKKKTTLSLNFYAHGKELVKDDACPSELTDPERIQVYKAITSLMNEYIDDDQIRSLEHAIYNATLSVADKKHIIKMWTQPLFTKIYTSVARMIVGNLNPTSYIKNENLYKRFAEGHLNLEDIASLGFIDLYPEIWKDLSIRQFEREKRLLEGNKSMATDQFLCKRCGKKECTYYELQTRSADEPMTIFIQCVNCGKHWRQ